MPPAAEAPDVELRPSHEGEPLRVLRIRARGRAEHPLEAGSLWLFNGELSDYHLGRVERRDLPETLAERIVPAESWGEGEGWVTIAPHAELTPGATYTLAAPGYGWLTAFAVSESDTTPLLERVWPPHDTAGTAAIVLCAADIPREAMTLALEPTFAAAELTPEFGQLADGRCCVRVGVESALEFDAAAVLPPGALGFLLDPAPLRAAEPLPLTALECFPHELRLGPGCAVVGDDRLELAPMPDAVLWRIQVADRVLLIPVAAGQPLALRGLVPDSEQRIHGSALSASGHESNFDLLVRTQPARAHLTLSEVLANPRGPEPASEWVELANDADVELNVAGFSFGDASGAAVLPDAKLGPRGYALLVRADFIANAGSDVVVPLGTPLIVLPSLGAKGLSNSGEALWLKDREGQLLSEFPARAAPRAGVSVARSNLDPGVFALHAVPGASPGAANRLEGQGTAP